MKLKLNKDAGIVKRIQDLIDSFYNTKAGMSGRKLTAFALILMMYHVHMNHVDNTNAVDVLWVDAILVLLLLGIITVQNLIELKNGSAQKNDQGNADESQK